MSYGQDIKALWRDHPVAQTSFLLAFAITRFSPIGTFPEHYTGTIRGIFYQDVQPWMTTGYIARSPHLHRPNTYAAAGLPKPVKRHLMTIRDIAAYRYQRSSHG